MNIEIANRLVDLRKENGLSQEELATRLGVSRQAVSKWERAESSPDTDNLIGLSRIYGISLDELLQIGTAASQTQSAPDTEDDAEDTGADYVNYETYEPPAPDVSWQQEQRRLRKHRFMAFPYPVFVTLSYLVMGFQIDLWHPGWLIFLTIPLYYGMAAAI